MFSIGDTVNHKVYGRGIVRAIRSEYETAFGVEFKTAPNGGHSLDGRLSNSNGRWVRGENLKTAGKPAAVKFVLVYDLQSTGDPVETFESRNALIKRIAELSASSDFVRESVRVYEVKKVSTAKITTRVALR